MTKFNSRNAAIVIGTLAILFPNISYAQTAPLGWGRAELSQDMETDRPDFTEGTQTVLPGHVQFELGYTYTKDDEGSVEFEEHVLPELLVRIGMIEDLELRLVWEGYKSVELNDVSDDGVTDFGVGFKHQMYDQSAFAPSLSILGELSLPTGSSDFSSEEIEATGKFLLAYALDTYSISSNVNFATPIGEEGRYLEVSSSLALGVELTETIGAYGEYYGFYPVEDVVETTEHYLNGGLTFAASEDLQFDLRAGFGLNRVAADLHVGLGFAFRI